MLRPSKYSHPDSTIISTSLLILKILKSKRIYDYSMLLDTVKKSVAGAENLYLPALGFLFLMGKIEYHKKTDSFEYVEHNETE